METLRRQLQEANLSAPFAPFAGYHNVYHTYIYEGYQNFPTKTLFYLLNLISCEAMM